MHAFWAGALSLSLSLYDTHNVDVVGGVTVVINVVVVGGSAMCGEFEFCSQCAVWHFVGCVVSYRCRQRIEHQPTSSVMESYTGNLSARPFSVRERDGDSERSLCRYDIRAPRRQ